MKTRTIAALGGASLVALVALIAAGTPHSTGTVPRIPDDLRVPATQRLALQVEAIGVQIYDCKPSKDDPERFEWAFRAPEAELYDEWGKRVGKHYAGPTWESYDGSKVVGEAKARSDGPDANAIPWLLLTAKSRSGEGVLGTTASIQRLRTVGGKAPSQGCSAALAGNEVRVPYTARYYFYEAKRYAVIRGARAVPPA
jgi:hypothetical protein